MIKAFRNIFLAIMDARHHESKVGMLELRDVLSEKLFDETKDGERLSYFWNGPNSCQETSLGFLKATGEQARLKVEFNDTEIISTIFNAAGNTVLATVTDKRRNSYRSCALTWSENLSTQLSKA